MGSLVKDNHDVLIYNSKKYINKQWGAGKFAIFANLCCVKTPTMAEFKLPFEVTDPEQGREVHSEPAQTSWYTLAQAPTGKRLKYLPKQSGP